MANLTNRRTFLTAGVVAAALLVAPAALTLSAPPAAAAPTAADALSGTWTPDKVHSDITFTVTHLAVNKVHGRFNDFDGTVVADGKKPSNSTVEFTIKTASIDTGNTMRDNHLKSPDFFDVEKFPDITFKSTRVAKSGKGFVAEGNLTIHGVTKPVRLPFTVAGPVKGPGGSQHVGVETSLQINRRDYGLTWSNLVEGTALVGDDVDIQIGLDLAKK